MAKQKKIHKCPSCKRRKARGAFSYFSFKSGKSICQTCVEKAYPTCVGCKKKHPHLFDKEKCRECFDATCKACGAISVLKKEIESNYGSECCGSSTTHRVYQCPKCKEIHFLER